MRKILEAGKKMLPAECCLPQTGSVPGQRGCYGERIPSCSIPRLGAGLRDLIYLHRDIRGPWVTTEVTGKVLVGAGTAWGQWCWWPRAAPTQDDLQVALGGECWLCELGFLLGYQRFASRRECFLPEECSQLYFFSTGFMETLRLSSPGSPDGACPCCAD